MNRTISFWLLAVLGTFSIQAYADTPVEAVSKKDSKVYHLQNDTPTILVKNLKFPSGITIDTNGMFQVADGKKRAIQEGQTIRSDGRLLSSDGSANPVFDHLEAKAGRIVLVRDGQVEPLTTSMTFPNHLLVNPDGSCIYPDGSRTRLIDGQLFRLDGTTIPSKDTVSLKNGRVVIQKDGSLISLAPVQIMGMSEGSRIQGDGYIVKRDGSKTPLVEGQTVFFDGPLVVR